MLESLYEFGRAVLYFTPIIAVTIGLPVAGMSGWKAGLQAMGWWFAAMGGLAAVGFVIAGLVLIAT